MTIQQPSSGDKLSNPDHGLSHRVFANDDSAPVQAIIVDSSGNVKISNLTSNGYITTSGGDGTLIVGDASCHVFSQIANATVSNTVNETTLITSGVGSMTLPANFFTIGRGIRVTARGFRSTGNPSGTLRLKVKLGSTVILDTTAITATNGLTNRAWELLGTICCRTTGISGTIMAQGKVNMAQTTTSANFWEMLNLSTITIDTTSSQLLDITAQWGTASISNIITCTNVYVECLN